MDDKEFQAIEHKLEYLIRELNKLQNKYRQNTGRHFILPMRMDEFESKWEIREVKND